MNGGKSCFCAELPNLAIIGMGDAEGLDDRVFATLDLEVDHSDEKWWLYASKCRACGQHWKIAQEERIHDFYCLKRIIPNAFKEIVQLSLWPSDFLLYEKVLRVGREAGYIATFMNPKSSTLVDTIADLRSARPDITLDEIAHVLAIPRKQVKNLLKT